MPQRIRGRTRRQWQTQRDEANAKIQDAYWLFTRCKRAAPPACVVPEAYTLRAEAEAALREFRKAGSGQLKPAA